MGKRIISQNRGRGGPTYRAPSHRYRADIKQIKVDHGQTVRGVVKDIVHDPGRTAPVALVSLDNGEERYLLVQEGIFVGQEIACGISAEIRPGNTLPLAEIPEGVPICNIESQPGHGGQFGRAGGVYGLLIAHDVGSTVVQLPSGEMKWLSPGCMATIGVVAGGGRTEKPLVKAGKSYHKYRSKAKKWPIVRGVAMNAIDHPFGGGGRQHPGRPKTVSRNTSPGRKVGSIAARRTGKR
ncbi:MAG: 50S ribosomal protein L2 [Methanotrichaceae archaeon]|nr:50S ribosomal protein L2 [Methanotrichaceae archaeon]